MGILVVAPICVEIFISKKDYLEDDEPNILGKLWRSGMDDKRVVNMACGKVVGYSSTYKSLCTSQISS